MGNSASSEDSETMIPSSSTVSGALSSLWSTSSDKDDTCVQWGLVCKCGSCWPVLVCLCLCFCFPEQEGKDHRIFL